MHHGHASVINRSVACLFVLGRVFVSEAYVICILHKHTHTCTYTWMYSDSSFLLFTRIVRVGTANGVMLFLSDKCLHNRTHE